MIRAFLSPRPWLLLAAALALTLSALTPAPPAQAQGSSNAGFGSDGTVTTDFGSGHDHILGVLVQPDGKILAAGRSHNGSNFDFALVRYNANGTLDTNFGGDADGDGNKEGWVTTAIGAGLDRAQTVAVLSDRKILVAGYSFTPSPSFNEFALVRYNPDGSLDTTFGTGGKVTTPIGVADDNVYAMLVQSNGKIVVAGESYDTSVATSDISLARYNPDGTLDTGFGTGGKVITDITSSSHDRANAVALQSNGKIVLAGEARIGGNRDIALARYNANGTLDTGFGTGGKVTTAIGSGTDKANAVAVQPDGKIVVTGYTYTVPADLFVLVRYNADGSLDTNFGGDADGDGNKEGWVTTAIGGSDGSYGYAMALQPDGKIVAAGYSTNGRNFDFALARYTPDGELDAPPTETIFPWSTTLTAQAVDYGFGCGYRIGQPQCADLLTDRVITYEGVDYTVELVHIAYAGGTLQFIMDKEPPASLRTRLRLNVGDREFSLTDDNLLVSQGIADDLDGDGVNEWTNTAAWVLSWTGTGLEWSAGDSISLSLDTPVGGL